MSASWRRLKYLSRWIIGGMTDGATRAKVIETLKETSQNANQPSILFFSLLLLAGFLLVALFRSSFAAVDSNLNLWVVTIQTGSFTVIAKEIALVFDTKSLIVISLVVAAILFARHYLRGGVLLLGAMAGDALLVEVTKTLVRSPRPTNMLVADLGYSFPSGHATVSIVFLGILTYLAWQCWNSLKVRAATCGLDIAVVVLIGFDRIYLNVHWFSDVIGGYLLGAFWLTFAITAFRYQRRKKSIDKLHS
jgi:undecaprenyl-diphosphatase